MCTPVHFRNEKLGEMHPSLCGELGHKDWKSGHPHNVTCEKCIHILKATPDLLEALKEASKALAIDPSISQVHAKRAVDKAIAKAEGRE